MRAVAHLYRKEGIRVNALCPGAVRTPILPPSGWENLPPDTFTPLGLVADVVLRLAGAGTGGGGGGDGFEDSRGVRVGPDDMYGQAVVASGDRCYVHAEPEYYDDLLARTFEANKHQKESLEE